MRVPAASGPRRSTVRLAVVLTGAVALGGCTNAQLYDMVQSHREMECLDLPAASIQDCLDAAREPYEDYVRKASEVLVRPDGTEGAVTTDDTRG